MIRSFRDRGTERVWLGEVSRRLPRDIQGTARRKLRLLHVARGRSTTSAYQPATGSNR